MRKTVSGVFSGGEIPAQSPDKGVIPPRCHLRRQKPTQGHTAVGMSPSQLGGLSAVPRFHIPLYIVKVSHVGTFLLVRISAAIKVSQHGLNPVTGTHRKNARMQSVSNIAPLHP